MAGWWRAAGRDPSWVEEVDLPTDDGSPTRRLDWTEATYAEDACDESWSRLARALCPKNEAQAVVHAESAYRRRYGAGFTPRKGEHVVARRARSA